MRKGGICFPLCSKVQPRETGTNNQSMVCLIKRFKRMRHAAMDWTQSGKELESFSLRAEFRGPV